MTRALPEKGVCILDRMREFVVDRFEKGYAVLERGDGKLIDVPAAELPEGSREGDALSLGEDGVYRADPEETRRRAAEIRNLQGKLFE